MTSEHEDIKNEEEEVEEADAEAGIDDSMLDAITSDDAEETDETEGFGHIKEDAPEKEEEEEEGESLEEDAEDVDYDSFDDEDHL